MKKEDKLMFEIEQLRKDNMIYMLESIGFTFICELVYFLVAIILGKSIIALALILIIAPTIFFLYVIYTNLLRTKEIKKLEKRLYK